MEATKKNQKTKTYTPEINDFYLIDENFFSKCCYASCWQLNKHVFLVGWDVINLHTVRKSRPHNKFFLRERQCVHFTTYSIHYSPSSLNWNNLQLACWTVFTGSIGHVQSRSKWALMKERIQKTPNIPVRTCRVTACSVQKILESFQESPWRRGQPAPWRAKRSWQRGFCREGLCPGCSGSLGNLQAWKTVVEWEHAMNMNKTVIT